LACAYARSGDTARARQLAEDAAAQIASLAGQTATATFECSFAQLWLSLACARIRLNDLEGGADCCERAHRLGWLDAAWRQIDRELQAIHDHPRFRGIVQVLESAPRLVLPPLVYSDRSGTGSASGTAS